MTITKPNKAEVWNTIYRTLIANEINPISVRLHPADISVDIQLKDDEFEDVAAALRVFGLPSGEVWSLDNDGPYLWSQGEASEFYAWGRYCNDYKAQSPLLPGWNVSIYCWVRTVNFLLPEPEPVSRDCFAPLVPEVAADASVLVAETVAPVVPKAEAGANVLLDATLAALPEPKPGQQYADFEGDRWQVQSDGTLLWLDTRNINDRQAGLTKPNLLHLAKDWGPLTAGPLVEVVPQPNAEAVQCGFRVCDKPAAEGDKYCAPHRDEMDSAMRAAAAYDRAMGS